MSLADIIALAAAMAAAISAVVAWVARRDSKRSADAAETTAKLTAQQVELTKVELNRQLENDKRNSQPLITWDYGSSGARSVTHILKNHGGAMSNVSVTCEAGFVATISPKDVIAQGTEAKVQFICKVEPQPNPLKFSIGFNDRFNERKRLNFTASRSPSGTWLLPEPA